MSNRESVSIDVVPAAEVVALRAKILRAGKPPEASIYPTDRIESTVHVGVRDETGCLIGCGSFHQEPFQGEPAWRLRGMAVDGSLQRSGVGARLLAAAEQNLLAVGHASLLWCNARSSAIGFYERQGWTVVSDPFVEDALPHVKMTKRLGNPVG